MRLAWFYKIIYNYLFRVGESELLMDWYQSMPAGFIDTIIHLAELIVLCVPASAAFIYYRAKTISFWVVEQTDMGSKIILHNNSNHSVFVSDIHVRQKEGHALKGICTSFVKSSFCLTPDESKEILVHYKNESTEKQVFFLSVKYNRNKKKSIRVVVKC